MVLIIELYFLVKKLPAFKNDGVPIPGTTVPEPNFARQWPDLTWGAFPTLLHTVSYEILVQGETQTEELVTSQIHNLQWQTGQKTLHHGNYVEEDVWA